MYGYILGGNSKVKGFTFKGTLAILRTKHWPVSFCSWH
jgi:hypothetical protein